MRFGNLWTTKCAIGVGMQRTDLRAFNRKMSASNFHGASACVRCNEDSFRAETLRRTTYLSAQIGSFSSASFKVARIYAIRFVLAFYSGHFQSSLLGTSFLVIC